MTSLIQLFRSRSRDRDEYVALLRPHISSMYRMAYRWTQSQQDAEDLVQDILTRLAGRLEELRRLEHPRSWLIKVLYRRYVDLYRRHQRSPVENDSGWSGDSDELDKRIQQAANPGDAIHQLELQQSLLKALETLDDDQRDTLLLHDVEGYTAVEVAEILEINVGTVKSRLHRARHRLKNFLGDTLKPGTF